MSEGELNTSTEVAAVTPRFPGDPAAAAAVSRDCAQTTWRWAWICVLLAIAASVALGVALSAANFGPNDDVAIVIGIFFICVPIATAVFFFFRVYYHHRTAAMADACDTMNFRFTEKASKQQLAAFTIFPLFKRGHACRGYYLMEGEVAGSSVCLMVYCYTTGHGKTAHVHSQTVVIVQAIDHLPDFELCPKGFWRKLGEIFGIMGITFHDNPKFAEAYDLQGADVKAIRAVFTPEAIAYFAANRDWTIEAKFGSVAIYQQDKTCRPEACPERVAVSLTMMRLLNPEVNADSNLAASE